MSLHLSLHICTDPTGHTSSPPLSRPYITLEDLQECLPEKGDAEEAFEMLDDDRDGQVSLQVGRRGPRRSVGIKELPMATSVRGGCCEGWMVTAMDRTVPPQQGPACQRRGPRRSAATLSPSSPPACSQDCVAALQSIFEVSLPLPLPLPCCCAESSSAAACCPASTMLPCPASGPGACRLCSRLTLYLFHDVYCRSGRTWLTPSRTPRAWWERWSWRWL